MNVVEQALSRWIILVDKILFYEDKKYKTMAQCDLTHKDAHIIKGHMKSRAGPGSKPILMAQRYHLPSALVFLQHFLRYITPVIG